MPITLEIILRFLSWIQRGFEVGEASADWRSQVFMILEMIALSCCLETMICRRVQIRRNLFGSLQSSVSKMLEELQFLGKLNEMQKIKREVIVPPASAERWKEHLIEDATYMAKIPESDVPNGPLYDFVKLNQIPALLAKEQIVRDTVVFVVDLPPPSPRMRFGKLALCVEEYLTDETIFPRCGVKTIWEENFHGNEAFMHGFTRQIITILSGLNPNIFKDRYGFHSFSRFTFDSDDRVEVRKLVKRKGNIYNFTIHCSLHYSPLLYIILKVMVMVINLHAYKQNCLTSFNAAQQSVPATSTFSDIYCKEPEQIITLSLSFYRLHRNHQIRPR